MSTPVKPALTRFTHRRGATRRRAGAIAHRARHACTVLLLLWAAHAGAQTRADGTIHWAYAAFFGTGHYSVGNEEDVYTFAFKPRWRFREASLDDNGRRQIGIALRFPVALGLYEVSAEAPTAGLERIGMASFVPGVEFEIPITSRWRIKPLAHFGRGFDSDGGAAAWIYWAGIKSELRLGPRESWALVNSLTFVGYSPSAGPSRHVLPLLTGFEFQRPLADTTLGGDPIQLHWHVAYTSYLEELAFNIADVNRPPAEIANEWELGVAFSKSGERLGLWKFRLDRLGIAYRFSSGGDFAGIGITFKSLFDR
jgi:hypothetical protein